MPNGKRQYVIDDLSMNESWRLFKIMSEIVDGFESMSELTKPAVSIFGSARTRPGEPLYEMAEKMARLLVQAGYAVITGGGPGLMEAANKGAIEAGGESAGLHIHLPLEQKSNDYINLRTEYRYFFVRKLMFVKYAMAYVALPGGFGTIDEISEALVLIQTRRIKPFPIVLIGKEFWSGLVEWMKASMIKQGFVAEEDMDLLTILDAPEEAVAYIKRHVII